MSSEGWEGDRMTDDRRTDLKSSGFCATTEQAPDTATVRGVPPTDTLHVTRRTPSKPETVSEEQLESLKYLVEIGSSGPMADDSRLDDDDRAALRALLADHAAGKERRLRAALMLISRGNDVWSAKIALAALAETRRESNSE